MSENPRNKLTQREKTRYVRQLLMADWSEDHQARLKTLNVAVMGIGGAASSILNNLLLLGVGTIQAFDHDVVELSNLNRQFVHDEEHIGMSKAESFVTYAKRLNPNVNIRARRVKIDEDTLDGILDPQTDIIIDTCDKWAFRSMVNKFAVVHHLPYLLAGVVSNCFYTALLHSPKTPCLSCLLGRFQTKNILGAFEPTVFPINILPLAALGAFSVAELIKYVIRREVSNLFYFGSLYETKQDIRFFSLFLSRHFRKISQEQGTTWGTEWESDGITKIALARDITCRVCGKR